MKKPRAGRSPLKPSGMAREDKAAAALARSGFDIPVPDIEILDAISSPARHKVVSALLDETGIVISDEKRDSFIENINAVLYEYVRRSGYALENTLSPEEALKLLIQNGRTLHSSIAEISRGPANKNMLDEYISRVVSAWWVQHYKKNVKKDSEASQVDLSEYEFITTHFSSVENISRSLSFVLDKLDELLEFTKKTSRYRHHEHVFVAKLAEIWHLYLGVYPTLSRNEYVPKLKKRPSAKLKPSRQFELFLRKLVPTSFISDETIRTVLEDCRANLGEGRLTKKPPQNSPM